MTMSTGLHRRSRRHLRRNSRLHSPQRQSGLTSAQQSNTRMRQRRRLRTARTTLPEEQSAADAQLAYPFFSDAWKKIRNVFSRKTNSATALHKSLDAIAYMNLPLVDYQSILDAPLLRNMRENVKRVLVKQYLPVAQSKGPVGQMFQELLRQAPDAKDMITLNQLSDIPGVLYSRAALAEPLLGEGKIFHVSLANVLSPYVFALFAPDTTSKNIRLVFEPAHTKGCFVDWILSDSNLQKCPPDRWSALVKLVQRWMDAICDLLRLLCFLGSGNHLDQKWAEHLMGGTDANFYEDVRTRAATMISVQDHFWTIFSLRQPASPRDDFCEPKKTIDESLVNFSHSYNDALLRAEKAYFFDRENFIRLRVQENIAWITQHWLPFLTGSVGSMFWILSEKGLRSAQHVFEFQREELLMGDVLSRLVFKDETGREGSWRWQVGPFFNIMYSSGVSNSWQSLCVVEKMCLRSVCAMLRFLVFLDRCPPDVTKTVLHEMQQKRDDESLSRYLSKEKRKSIPGLDQAYAKIFPKYWSDEFSST